MSFKIGNKVKFAPEGLDIPTYFTGNSGIPEHFIHHGNTELGKEYKTEFATIVGKYDKYYIVEYTDDLKRKVRLGFLEENLKLVKVTNWQEVIENG